jgi:hypothetical protein
MLLLRYRAPKIERRAAFGRMTDCGLENQSRDRSRRRGSTTILTGIGISKPSWLIADCNFRFAATTTWPPIRLNNLMRSAHCRSVRRRKLKGFNVLIRSTSLTRSEAWIVCFIT